MMIKISQIEDGTSKTYCVGEGYLNPDIYLTDGHNNDWTAYNGFQDDHDRTVGYHFRFYPATEAHPPTQDTPGLAALNMESLSAAPILVRCTWRFATGRCNPLATTSTWKPIGRTGTVPMAANRTDADTGADRRGLDSLLLSVIVVCRDVKAVRRG